MVEVIVGKEIKIRLNMNIAELKIAMTHPPGIVFSLNSGEIELLQGAASIGIIVNNKELESENGENNNKTSE